METRLRLAEPKLNERVRLAPREIDLPALDARFRVLD